MSRPFMFARCPTVVMPHSIEGLVSLPQYQSGEGGTHREETGDKEAGGEFSEVMCPQSTPLLYPHLSTNVSKLFIIHVGCLW